MAITYNYEYERLTEINYPQNPENNVRYTYGEAGAGDNRAGRVVLQEDGSGAQEFFYGPLGEVIKNVRTVVIPQHGEQTYVTQWSYDTWNRLTSMTYADGEQVDYVYNVGGLLNSMSGKKKGRTYSYVKQLGYDKFEQRVFLHYGNGTKTTYSYEADRRRLQNMVAKTAGGRAMMDNVYSYDKVNNIVGLKNNAPIPAANLMGGSSDYSYSYDDLYRLTEAKGSFKGPNDEHSYSLQMSYNSVGGILEKNQSHLRKGQVQKKTTYDLAYTYGQEQPHAAVHIGEQTYSYDANGNQTGWTHDKTGQRRNIMWDEENRIRAIMDNGATYHYIYDASGERVLKGHSSGQAAFVNREHKAGSASMSNYTVYVNPYLVLKSGGYTKHYYIEGQRIVSKLGGGWDNSGKGPLKAGGDKVNYANKEQQVIEGIVKNLKFLGLDGQILTAGKSGKVPPGQLKGNAAGGGNGGGGSTSTAETFQYFYHPDHLGSTSYVTDTSGEVYQHVEYFAFGETFVEEHSNTDRTPYLFNGKELDEETGLYYYGARYYDARTSVWASVDPLAEKYPNWSPYNFTLNNPVKFIDPDGMEVINADVAKRDQTQAALNNAQQQHNQNVQTRGIERTEGMSKKEMKQAGIWNTQKAVNKAQRAFNKANRTFQQTQGAIDALRANDPNTFNQLNNLTYNGREIDVYVTSGESLKADQHGAQTAARHNDALNRIYTDLPGNNARTLDAITVRLQPGVNNSDVKLAHEAGHIFTIVRDPARFYRELQKADCQDPANRNLYQVREAMDTQENYIRLREHR